jgi:hypothetical protein
MFKVLQVTGPVAPGQFQPMQVSGPSSYYPMQTTDWTSMFTAIMPMIMMMMMMGMMIPMMKGMTAQAK